MCHHASVCGQDGRMAVLILLLQATTRNACMPTDNNNNNFSSSLITRQTSSVSQSHSTDSTSDFPSSIHLGEAHQACFKMLFMQSIHSILFMLCWIKKPIVQLCQLFVLSPQAAFECISDAKNITENQTKEGVTEDYYDLIENI